AIAILAPGRQPLTFDGLIRQIEAVRATLHGRGLGRGDRVAVLVGRGPEAAVAVLAIACCATCVPLNAAAPAAELEQALAQTGGKALVVTAGASSALRELARRLAIALLEYVAHGSEPAGAISIQGGNLAPAADWRRPSATDVAFIMQTSGTTSRPKIVPI